MIQKIRSLFLSFGLCFVVAACTSSPISQGDNPAGVPTPLAQLTYEHLSKIPVKVTRIEMSSDTQRGSHPGDIADKLVTPPDVAMRRYLGQRFVAKGQDGVLGITLQRASVSMEEVPNDNRFLSMISFADNHDYTYEIVLGLESLYNSGLPDRTTSIKFVRKLKLAPHVTMAYREAMLQRTLEEVIRDVDEALISKLAYEFNIVPQGIVPSKQIEIKTQAPQMETIHSNKGEVITDMTDPQNKWITTRDVND